MSNIRRQSKQSFNKEIMYYIYKEMYDTALSKIDSFLHDYPNDVFALTYKAKIYRKKKNSEKALQILEPIINNPPIDKEIKLFSIKEYANNLFELRRNDEALYYYMQVIEESSEEEDAIRVKVAKIHRFNNDLKSAISILTSDKDNEFLKLNRAYMYSEFREWEMLKKELNKIKKKISNMIV